MTYGLQTKNELARCDLGRACCQRAELAAFIRLGGNIQITGKRLALNVVTSNPAVARRIFTLFKQLFNLSSEILVRRRIRLRKNNVYLVRVADPLRVREVLSGLGLMKDGELSRDLSNAGFNRKCCRRSYLRGAFLAAGSVSNPESSYHMEIYADYQEQAEHLAGLINFFGPKAKITTRKNGFLVYLKEGDQIIEFLNIIGAHSALLNFENIRIIKSIRNSINRLVNFETANVSKTVEASLRQAEALKIIEENVGINALPPPLRELAELRLANPEASLQELGEMLDPPLGKSGVNHRLRKLEKAAKQFKKEK